MYKLTRKRFFEIWRSTAKENRQNDLLRLIMEDFDVNNLNNETKTKWMNLIKDFSKKINDRWEMSFRKAEVFAKKFDSWLDKEDVEFEVVSCSFDENPPNEVTGRPRKLFEDVQYRTKKQKVQHILDCNYEEITFAAEVSVRNSGRKDAANLLKEITHASPQRSTAIKNMRTEKKSLIQRQYSKEEALALFVDCKLTKQAYIVMRQSAIQVGHFLYPSYNKLQVAKNECCPSVDFMHLTETRAEIGLQALLDHTTRRLIEVQMPVLKHLVSLGVTEFKLVSKWGCDGSSGHSRYIGIPRC